MPSKKDSSKKVEQEARDILFNQHEIEELKHEFDLSEDAYTAATLIYRVLNGLGKGLSDSQKRSFSALSIKIAAEKVDGVKLSKKKLSEAVDVSPRTLSRRFKELEEDEETEKVLAYVRQRVKRWSDRRERRLNEIL